MKVRTYVLVGIVTLLSVSAITNDVRSTEGFSPGDLAPRIESLRNESDFNFQNHSGRYTLLNFWAAYDAESRARNTKLSNEVNKLSSEKIALRAISFDENESIFSETVKIDNLNEATQFHAGQLNKSELFQKYNLKRGLRNFLIDDKGVIVATDVTPEELKNVLNTI